MPSDDWIEWAKVGRPHGLRGEVRLFLHNPDSDAIERVDRVRLGRSVEDAIPLRITSLRPGPKAWIVCFDGVNGRNDAEAITNALVFVPADLFPPLDRDDEGYYAFELEGLQVLDPQGKAIGKVMSFVDFGAGDMLLIRHEGDQTYVPFSAPYVGEISLDEGTIVVDIMDLADE